MITLKLNHNSLAMKNFNALLSGLFLAMCLHLACTEADNTIPTTEEQTISVTDTAATESLQLTNVPIFDSITITESSEPGSPDGPGSLGPTPVGNVLDRKQVRVVPNINLIIKKNNVNGTLTVRQPFLNSSLYLDIYKGNSFSGTNLVECGCDKTFGATQIKMVLYAKSDKIYVMRINAEPRGESAQLGIFTTGFLHHATVTKDRTNFEVLFSPSQNGRYDFWMQCADPNRRFEYWTFKSITINEVDKP